MRWLPLVLLALLAAGGGPLGVVEPGGHAQTQPDGLVAFRNAPPTVPIAKLLVPTPVSATAAGAQDGALDTVVREGGGPTQLLVLDRRTVAGRPWLQVLLPSRPNGASAWLPADRTRQLRTPWRIVVSLADRRLYAQQAGVIVRSFPVVIGARATPTPTGSFAVSERIALPEPDGFYGSWMLTLTAHSTVLDTFEGGDGRVALHGRGDAALADPLGSATSHGCIRLDNAAIAWLARFAQPGTPVDVTSASLSRAQSG